MRSARVTTQPSGSSKREFAHAVELIFHRHGDLRAVLLHSHEEILDPLHFNEQSEAATDLLGAERGIIFGDDFVVVEENFHAVGDYGAEHIRRTCQGR